MTWPVRDKTENSMASHPESRGASQRLKIGDLFILQISDILHKGLQLSSVFPKVTALTFAKTVNCMPRIIAR